MRRVTMTLDLMNPKKFTFKDEPSNDECHGPKLQISLTNVVSFFAVCNDDEVIKTGWDLELALDDEIKKMELVLKEMRSVFNENRS